MNSVEFLLPQQIANLPKPFVVVCEGYGDARLLCALLRHKQIEKCVVGCPNRTTAADIPGYLRAIKALNTLHPVLRGLLLVRDANEDPDGHFREMVAALKIAGFPAPAKPFAIEDGELRVGIFLMPGVGRSGTLEHLLLEAVIRSRPTIGQCVDSFSDCMDDGRSWTDNQRAKMKMSAIVAGSCRRNPWASPGLVWDQEDNPIPVESECFNELGELLDRLVS